jgi:hypothetical protein
MAKPKGSTDAALAYDAKRQAQKRAASRSTRGWTQEQETPGEHERRKHAELEAYGQLSIFNRTEV